MVDNRVFLNMERYIQLKKILSDVTVPYAVIKGEPLSLLCYNEKSVRNSQDIDILIDRQHISYFERLLQENDFIRLINQNEFVNRESRILCISQSHQIPPYVKETSNQQIEIDLNFDIFWGEYTGKRIDIAEFLADTIMQDIYGCKVKTLPPLKAMVQLILHHYKEMNSIYHLTGHNCINYNMFKDVYYLWKNNQEAVSLDKLYAISSEYEIIPYVFYVLYFTNWIFKDTELQKYVETFRTSEGEAHLDYYGLTEKERKPWKVDFQTRLEADNLYEFIRDDLTEADVEKLERNRRIFG